MTHDELTPHISYVKARTSITVLKNLSEVMSRVMEQN